jgi:hypothetical protein
VTSPRGLAALLSAAALALPLASCGGEAQSDRPAHRPISVIYVAGEPTGPWAARTEGLADGVKLAIAERGGIIGERAVSTVVVPVVQRDGNQNTAAIGAGRILRDSRTLAVLGTYSALQLPQAAPQLNGGEIALLQYGSGMDGLTTADPVRHEPERFEPSGRSFAVRGVQSDTAVAAAVAAIPGTRKIYVAASDSAARRSAGEAGAQAAKDAQRAYERAIERGLTGKDLPSRSAADVTSVWSSNDNDATRLAGAIQRRTGGTVGPPSEGPASRVLVIDAEQPDPAAEARAAARRGAGTLVLVDTADRAIPASAVAGHDGPVFRVRRILDDASSAEARKIRERERELFGRDRGDAVVAGYRAARRILGLAAAQPEKTIDRVTYATALAKDAPSDPDLPVKAHQVQLGEVVVEQLRGGRWVAR